MGMSNYIPSSALTRAGVCTSSTRPASPYTGQIIYETDTSVLRVWSGSAWLTYTPQIPHTQVASRILSSNNIFSNQTSYGDFPISADATALQMSFTKYRSDTIIVVSVSFPIYFSSGVAQTKYIAININGTDYRVANIYLQTAIQTATIVGSTSISGIAAGTLTIKPRFATDTASADQFLSNIQCSYTVTETFQ